MIVSHVLQLLARVLIGAYPRWVGCKPTKAQRIYFANHTSHIDGVAIWASLPRELQKTTHPVAAYDYWATSKFKNHVAQKGLNAVYVARASQDKSDDPLQPLYDVLAKGESLIIFPEGTRNKEDIPQSFKSGLYFLASKFPHVELIPVYLENSYRSLPKGKYLPVPLICTVRFGKTMFIEPEEGRRSFLDRTRQAVIDSRSIVFTRVRGGHKTSKLNELLASEAAHQQAASALKLKSKSDLAQVSQSFADHVFKTPSPSPSLSPSVPTNAPPLEQVQVAGHGLGDHEQADTYFQMVSRGLGADSLVGAADSVKNSAQDSAQDSAQPVSENNTEGTTSTSKPDAYLEPQYGQHLGEASVVPSGLMADQARGLTSDGQPQSQFQTHKTSGEM